MTEFNWCIDNENYLSNKDKYADKLSTKDFIKYVVGSLNEYKVKYTLEQLKSGTLKRCHPCMDLNKKKSDAAKRLLKHFEKINEALGKKECVALEFEQIFQLPIKGIADKTEYRCFGYILRDIFYLVYLDPNHEVYKQ